MAPIMIPLNTHTYECYFHEDTLRHTMLMDDGKWGRREQGQHRTWYGSTCP